MAWTGQRPAVSEGACGSTQTGGAAETCYRRGCGWGWFNADGRLGGNCGCECGVRVRVRVRVCRQLTRVLSAALLPGPDLPRPSQSSIYRPRTTGMMSLLRPDLPRSHGRSRKLLRCRPALGHHDAMAKWNAPRPGRLRLCGDTASTLSLPHQPVAAVARGVGTRGRGQPIPVL